MEEDKGEGPFEISPSTSLERGEEKQNVGGVKSSSEAPLRISRSVTQRDPSTGPSYPLVRIPETPIDRPLAPSGSEMTLGSWDYLV